jgi:shikimate dehydrogenase
MGAPITFNVRMHNAAYAALGLDYTFVCFGVSDPAAAVDAIRALGIRGMNVSMPHKIAVLPLLDAVDASAREIGAVNTIDHRDGKLTGYNTDAIGAVRALEEQTSLPDKRLAVLGAGGAARAIAYGTKKAGSLVTIFNRTPDRARNLAADLGTNYGGSLSDFESRRFDVVVNATAAGFRAPDVSPLDGKLAPHLVVMDAAFLPVNTKLIRDARAIGCKVVDGTRMMLHQAGRQVELYTDRQAPIAAMESALLEEIARVEKAA